MRNNIYKEKITNLLGRNHLLSTAEIHKAIPEADYSTVYRNVEQLLDEGVIKKVLVDQKNSFYELAARHAHDHFVCDDCSSISQIEIPRKMLKISMRVRDVTVRGLCNKCNK